MRRRFKVASATSQDTLLLFKATNQAIFYLTLLRLMQMMKA